MKSPSTTGRPAECERTWRTRTCSLPLAANSGQYRATGASGVERAGRDEPVRTRGRRALGRREDERHRVRAPRPVGRDVGEAARQVDDGHPVDVDAAGRADLAVLEVPGERVGDGVPPGCHAPDDLARHSRSWCFCAGPLGPRSARSWRLARHSRSWRFAPGRSGPARRGRGASLVIPAPGASRRAARAPLGAVVAPRSSFPLLALRAGPLGPRSAGGAHSRWSWRLAHGTECTEGRPVGSLHGRALSRRDVGLPEERRRLRQGGREPARRRTRPGRRRRRRGPRGRQHVRLHRGGAPGVGRCGPRGRGGEAARCPAGRDRVHGRALRRRAGCGSARGRCGRGLRGRGRHRRDRAPGPQAERRPRPARPRPAGARGTVGLRQDRRGLRPSVRVLRHPVVPRDAALADAGVDRGGGRVARRAWCHRDRAGRAGPGLVRA